MACIGVVLSGCGVYDGSEIQEAVLTLLALAQNGADYQCMAPDKEQMHVVDHVTGQPVQGSQRNVLAEAARIARGAILPLSEVDPNELDGLILPGGFGAAKNLSSYAVDGTGMSVDEELAHLVGELRQQGKPLGFICIAPVIAARLVPEVTVTIGCDDATAQDIESMGAQHDKQAVDSVTIDEEANVLSTPAYMLGPGIADVARGIEALVTALLDRIPPTQAA